MWVYNFIVPHFSASVELVYKNGSGLAKWMSNFPKMCQQFPFKWAKIQKKGYIRIFIYVDFAQVVITSAIILISLDKWFAITRTQNGNKWIVIYDGFGVLLFLPHKSVMLGYRKFSNN